MNSFYYIERTILFLVAVVILIGIVSPRTIWMLDIGFLIKGAEPTKAALVVTRIISILAAILLVVLVKEFF
ncbi:MAG: hypothetical protein GX197_10770 [Firmicutes bacterium]|nr:hypothetical protein [Bacillota bacterium]